MSDPDASSSESRLFTHRCHVCGSEDAPWGFTYPLAPKGQEFWACRAHRAQLEAMLTVERSELPAAQGKLKFTRTRVPDS